MFTGLIIENYNVLIDEDTMELDYKNRVILINFHKHCITGIKPHLYCMLVDGVLMYGEDLSIMINSVNTTNNKESKMRLENMKDTKLTKHISVQVESSVYKQKLRCFLKAYELKKRIEIKSSMEAVRFYLMFCDVSNAQCLLKTMNTTPDVKMLIFILNTSQANHLMLSDTEFKEFTLIYKQLDTHSGFMFILETLNKLKSENLFRLDDLIKKIHNFKTNTQSKLLTEYNEVNDTINRLYFYVRFLIAETLNNRKQTKMSAIFYIRASEFLYKSEDRGLVIECLARAINQFNFKSEDLHELYDLMTEHVTSTMQMCISDIEKFYLFQSKLIFNHNINEVNKESMQNENFILTFTFISNLFEFQIVKLHIKDSFTDRIEIKVQDKKIKLVCVYDEFNRFYPVINHNESSFIYFNESLFVSGAIDQNGKRWLINKKYKKIQKITNLIFVNQAYNTKDLPEDVLNKVKDDKIIIVFEYQNGNKCNYFVDPDIESIKNVSNVYLLIDKNKTEFNIDIEIAPNIFERQLIKMSH